jgi:hypothetical protein
VDGANKPRPPERRRLFVAGSVRRIIISGLDLRDYISFETKFAWEDEK